MTVLDDIAAEKQRIADRLARVDAERERLAQQLAELDAAEPVLSRMALGASRRRRRGLKAVAAEAAVTGPSRRSRRTRQAETTAAAPSRRRGVGRSGRRTRQKPAVALGNATLQAVETLGNNASADQICGCLADHFGMQVRPNHLGMALQRPRRAGRLQEADGRWSSVSPVSGEMAT